MSKVLLASRNSPESYPDSLHNLSKRFRSNNDGEAIHYSELSFGSVSKNQAKDALRFFSKIDLIENTKNANYLPPQCVVNWQLKMGDKKEEAKKQVYELLEDYEVFKETVFVLQEGSQEIDSLVEQVGGLVGIDEDEKSDLKKTIKIFSEMGFLTNEEGEIGLEELDKNADKKQDSSENSPEKTQKKPQNQGSDKHVSRKTESKDYSRNIEIQVDATELETDELRSKLEIIEEFLDDEEKLEQNK